LVGFFGAEQDGDAVVGARDEQRVLPGVEAMQAVAAQTVAQNDQAGLLDAVDLFL